MNRQQKLALRLAVMPMLAGLAALGAWTVFELRPLLFVGYGCLVLGVVIALLVPFVLLRAFSETPNVRNTIIISLLAVANVPVLFFCAMEGVLRETRYRVTLRNQALTPWSDVQLISTGVVGQVGSVPANAEVVRDMWFEADGRLELHFRQGGQPCSLVVAGYVTRNLGGAATVVRDQDGQVRVAVN